MTHPLIELTPSKLLRLAGLIDTKDITDWENTFLQSVIRELETRKAKGHSLSLTNKQHQVLSDLWHKHFAA